MIRLADKLDIGNILKIKNEAVELLGSQGIDQWQDEYPNRQVFLEDIYNKSLYLYDDGDILGFIALIAEKDPAYESLIGSWESDSYIAMHRIAVAGHARRRGIGKELFQFAKEIGLSSDVEALRIDTHKDNISMQKLIEKNGFTYKGIINKGKRSERKAYEYIL